MVVAKASNLKVVLAGARAEVARARDELAIELVANLTIATPVRTGWARANWICALNAISDDAQQPKNENDAKVRAPGQLARQQAAILELIQQGPSEPMAKAIVGNHVPYINRLNQGWSQQQSPGWIEREIQHTVDTFQVKQRARRVEL